MKTSRWLRSQNAHPLLPHSPHLCSCISASRPGGGGGGSQGKKAVPCDVAPRGGRVCLLFSSSSFETSRSVLKPPALLVSMSDLALSLCVSHFFFIYFFCTFSVTPQNLPSAVITVVFHIFSQFLRLFFNLSFYIENTPMNSVHLSGIIIFILAVSPFK